ncbi:hypothetical protein BJX66DRAFT_344973 [Aspergillus keveii]|uniref:Nephrocystin 3-like N-terminal domain-containing protein n=1 Tax=Aspergillus keveii TaxID=714993 RepID=A0ABR4FJG2_9EURO
MAEALGIASGAAGIVSLGLDITQGLLKYYAAWRDQDKDIMAMYESLTILSNLLSLLQRKLQTPATIDTEAKENVEKSIESVLGNMKSLKAELGRIRTTGPSTRDELRGKMRCHVLRMKYPFKAETLRNIRDNIAEARSDLSLAIQLLQIDKFSETAEKVDLIIRWQQDKETRKVMEWLSPTNFWLKQADVMKQRQPRTAEWLLTNPDFLDWETGKTDILWCQGSPGVGKTVLSSVIVDFLEGDLPASDISFAFVYCNYTLSQIQRVEYFLRAIARQIVGLRHSIPGSVLELYRKHRGKETAATEDECKKLLHSLYQDSCETYLVIDALDECINSQGGLFWTQLLRQLTSSITNLRLLCTSRHIEDPGKIFDRLLVSKSAPAKMISKLTS